MPYYLSVPDVVTSLFLLTTCCIQYESGISFCTMSHYSIAMFELFCFLLKLHLQHIGNIKKIKVA